VIISKHLLKYICGQEFVTYTKPAKRQTVFEILLEK